MIDNRTSAGPRAWHPTYRCDARKLRKMIPEPGIVPAGGTTQPATWHRARNQSWPITAMLTTSTEMGAAARTMGMGVIAAWLKLLKA